MMGCVYTKKFENGIPNVKHFILGPMSQKIESDLKAVIASPPCSWGSLVRHDLAAWQRADPRTSPR